MESRERSPLAALVADDLDHRGLHEGEVEAAVEGRGEHLLQQLLHHRLVSHEPPQVQLQVVAVHLGRDGGWK